MTLKSRKPPVIAKFFLNLLLNHKYPEIMLGDFEEQYNEIAQDKGLIRAKFWYWFQIITTIPSYIKNATCWSVIMFSNYFKIAIRNIKKHKAYSFINISGLAIGMACAILILLWVRDELSYDKFHENEKNIYRIVHKDEGSDFKSVMTPIPLAPYLREEYPEVISAARFTDGFQVYSIKCGEKDFAETIGIVDPSFFEIFTFPFVEGNPQAAFADPHSLVMTEKMAKKYFGSDDPLGKTLRILSFNNRGEVSFTVTGILKDIPQNSHIKRDIFISFNVIDSLIWWIKFDNWGDWSFFTYVLLQESNSRHEVSRKITDLVRKNDSESSASFSLQPLSRIHLYSDFKLDLAGHGDIFYIYVFTTVAFFILLIACINFMNLSTARSALRAKEVGLRKTVGANRIQLVRQFLSESIFLSVFSFLIALILVELIQPVLNQLSGKQLSVDYSNFRVILTLLIIVIFTGIISGSYPALFLSAFKPALVLKGNIASASKGALFRRLLVVAQFSLSIIIIVCTIVVFNQLVFVRNQDLGFVKENVIYMPLRGEFSSSYDVAKNEIKKNPNVLDVSGSDQLLTFIPRGSTGTLLGGTYVCDNVSIGFFEVDYNFFETFNINVIQGRIFSKEFSTDAAEAIMINESLVEAIDEESLIGRRLKNFMDGSVRSIVGVVEDFHFESLHSPVKPLMIIPAVRSPRFMYVKLKEGTVSPSIKFLEKIWKKYGPKSPFEFHFLDETIDNLYYAEKRVGKIFRYFACLAIFISCLGLYGLASFLTEQRTKEIGVRKVLGSSVPSIVLLLTKDFSKWVLMANLIAWPVAYYAMNKWLQNFAFHIRIEWWIFVAAGALALSIALLTVIYQAVKAATSDPVEALRYE